MFAKKNILGVGITNATKKEILEYVIENLKNFKKKLFLVTPNPEFLVLASKNSIFKDILNKADLALADGIGVIIAAKILSKDLTERFAGVDLVKSLCKGVAEKPITVGFLGGRDGVAEKTAECLLKKYPGLKVAFVSEEWQNDVLEDPVGLLPRPASSPASPGSGVRQEFSVPATRPESFSPNGIPSMDVLFVAFGAPKQEFWISENLNKLPVKVVIGVGGTFDYISGKIPRAPGFVRNIGLEWLFRLTVQPWRIKRQLSLIKFAWLIIKEKFK